MTHIVHKHHPHAMRPRRIPRGRLLFYFFLSSILLVLTILYSSKIVLFLFLVFVCSIINYQTNMTTIRFNPQPEVFSSLLIAEIMGFGYSFFMLIIPTVIVDIYTARLNMDTIISLLFTAIISYVISVFMPFGFVIFGIILVLFKFLLCLLISIAINVAPQEILFEHVLGFIVNVLLFLTLGNLFYTLFA